MIRQVSGDEFASDRAAVRHAGVNLKLLRSFRAVARHLSFSRAAAELHRSQATLSVQVRDLEHQLNATLLERTTRKVRLTKAGEALAKSLEIGFGAIESGLDDVLELTQGRLMRIVMACVPSLSATVLPPILAAYRQRDAATPIEVRELTSLEIFDAMADRVIDFGVGPCMVPPPSGISFNAVLDDPLYALLPAEQCPPSGELDFSSCISRPLITLSGSVLLQDLLDEAASRLGLELSALTEVRHVQTAIAMALAGVGTAIVPLLALPPTTPEGVVAVPIVNPTLVRKIGLITAAGYPLDGGAAKLAQSVRAALASLRQLSGQGYVVTAQK